MAWEVILYPAFRAEFAELPNLVQRSINNQIDKLRLEGPSLGRPNVDTLRASRHDNMKELRLRAMGNAWRVAFAFDPNRQAILLLAGSKKSGTERLFYRRFIEEADARFDDHLDRL